MAIRGCALVGVYVQLGSSTGRAPLLTVGGAGPAFDTLRYEQTQTRRASRAAVQGRGCMGKVACQAARHVRRSVAAYCQGPLKWENGVVRRGARRRALLRLD